MVRLLNHLVLVGIVLHAASANTSSGGKIDWGPCTEFTSKQAIECANLTVPLDYTHLSSNKTLNLQLLRVPAARQPSKGSILFNFGGPSIPGRPILASGGPVFSNVTSEYHDLVTFDPRLIIDVRQANDGSGTGNTLPFSCYQSNEERDAFILKNPLAWSLFKRPGGWVNSSDITLARYWASSKLLADQCYKNSNETGGLIGTAFVARDMMQIVDALGEDGLLRYWGGSYGTLLGQTAAAMFPDRIDRMVLDGNMNGHEYWREQDDQAWADSDKVFSAIFKNCTADPTTCPLASRNMTAAELEEAVYDLISEVNDRPVPFNGTLIDYNLVKTGIESALYNPGHWPVLRLGLDNLMSGNYTGFMNAWMELMESYDSNGGDGEMQMGIKCGDKIPRVSSLQEFMPIFERQSRFSRIFGDVQTGLLMVCANWKMPAKEQYDGDFSVKTKHPILFIGNTADAMTPLVSARNMSAAFEGSVVLHNDGYGHGSIATSSCIAQLTTEYYVNGTLPKADTFCELDDPIVLESKVRNI